MPVCRTTTTAVSAGTDWRELAMREGDGIEVRLLWSKSADRVKVTVADSISTRPAISGSTAAVASMRATLARWGRDAHSGLAIV